MVLVSWSQARAAPLEFWLCQTNFSLLNLMVAQPLTRQACFSTIPELAGTKWPGELISQIQFSYNNLQKTMDKAC